MKRIKYILNFRSVFFAMMLVLSITSLANNYIDKVFDGINYRLNFHSYNNKGIPESVTAEVMPLQSGKYSGFISIPPSVTWTDTWCITYYNGNNVLVMEDITFTKVCPVTEIGSGAFNDCNGLTGVSIPNSVLVIGNGSFKNCTNLTNVVIPNSVTDLYYEAFSGCSGLQNLTIGSSVVNIGNAVFAYCASLTEVNIPNSVVSIGGGAFMYCSGLTNVFLGESLKNIHNGAFSDCKSITSVTIPSSVEFIGTCVFAKCVNLTSVTCLPETPPRGADSDTFQNLYDQITLHVPAGSLYEYQTTSPWKYFYQILPIEQEYTVMLDQTNAVVEKGDFVQLKATVSPDDDFSPSVTWSSSDSGVATVNDWGIVTAVDKGNATITAHVGNTSATCNVRVVEHMVMLDQSSATIPLYSTLQLNAMVTPQDGYEPSVIWNSSMPGVATVTSTGLVKGNMIGTSIITAKVGRSTASCVVTVSPIQATSLELNAYQKQIETGQIFTLVAMVYPELATNYMVTWTIPNTDVISYTLSGNECIIIGEKVGQVTITARTTDGSNLSKSCVVTVLDDGIVVLAESITLDEHNLTMNVGSSKKLTATIMPVNTSNKNINWTSSNKAVATVDSNGIVKAIKKGNVIITASTTDGTELSDRCVVTIVTGGHDSSLRGDVDKDGNINISDVTSLIDYLLSGNADGISLENADCDESGNINISDVTSLIDYLLSGSW